MWSNNTPILVPHKCFCFAILLIYALLCDIKLFVNSYVLTVNASIKSRPLPLLSLLQHSVVVSEEKPSTSLKICVHTDCNSEAIQEIAAFLIDAYWMTTPRLWTDPTASLSCDVPSKLSIVRDEAANYLYSQYGERVGKRSLKTCIITAKVDSILAGALCMHELIWDDGNILPDEESETMLRNAIAALSPKDRRLWKDASPEEIASELMSSSAKAVCVFSNLAVSAAYRRRGIAVDLCQAAEETAKEWGYNYLHLKVEAENTPAAILYQEKLGYTVENHLGMDAAIRLDLAAASFVDTEVETLILKKRIL